jgi:hypothetical protein
MTSQSIHVRPNAERVALLDAIRAKERTGPSRNAMATILLEDAIDREAERLNLYASAEPKVRAGHPPHRNVPLHRAEPAIAGAAPDATVHDRFRRLLVVSGISEAALVRQLGLSSRGKLQHALRRGEVPPEVETWMRAQEGGGK